MTFSNISANGDSGVVKFTTPLAPNASAYFSLEGALSAATINYAAGPPSATIGTPADHQTYAVNQVVATSFSCTEATNGPGIATCTDQNASPSPSGVLDTSTAGTFTYTVTATSSDGQTGTATIHYTVAGPPSASISAPADSQTYAVNQVVATSFSCTEGTSGPGIATCTDQNASPSPSGALDTSTAGTFTYTVTATSGDGQFATATIHYTVAGAPSASISAPADNKTYNLHQAVATSFSCTEGTSGPGIATCTDQNASPSPGALNTATAGTFTYTVTATSTDGQTGTATIHYTVVGPPSASISAPADNKTYNLHQTVATSFSCTEATNGPGVATCTDQNGISSPNAGALDTSTAGTFTYTVTATSGDGQFGTATIHYTVVGPPSASISAPADNKTYNLHQTVATSFSCTEATNGPGVATCADQNASPSPGALNTATAGTFTYTVTATSTDGQTGTATIHYTVVGPPSASISAPADNQTYNLHQAVATSFSCTEATNGPGVATCTDQNASPSPGVLNTATAGAFTYTVTATSADGQSATATIHYTVVGPPSASISAPADNQTYIVNTPVATSFSCKEATNGPGIATCADQNASPNAGALNTSTAGFYSYKVTATSGDGQTGTATIHYTVVNVPLTNTGLPALSGKAQEGQALATTDGIWSGAPPPTFTYRWLRCDALGNGCTPIGGATSAGYVAVLLDVGHTLRAEVKAKNAAGSLSAASLQSAVVLPAATKASVLPMISGTPQQGQALSASTGSWTNSPTGFAYQWLQCDSSGNGCNPITTAATGPDYTPVVGDVGQTLRVTVTASNAAGNGSATSTQTAVVLIAAPVNTPPPVLSGTTELGQPLTASTGGWLNSPAGFTYQWLQCDSLGNGCTKIMGAMGSSYVPAPGDAGHTLRVIVTASNPGGSTSATSLPSAIVTAPLQASIAAPVLGKTSDAGPVSGTVLIRLPGSLTFTLLSNAIDVPFGSTIDARLGKVSLTEALPMGAYQTGQFYSGEFVLTQLENGTTIPTLTGGSFLGCPVPSPSHGRKAAARSAAGRKKRGAVIRQLWGSAHGQYVTKGRYGSASVSGTIWLTEDRCDGTFVYATKDDVIVVAYAHPKHKHKVRQGHHFLIPAPGF